MNVEHRQGRGIFAEATVKVRVDGEVLHTAAEGNGPVNALDEALRKALTPIYPELAQFHLADYKVRILDGENGTRATTRVLIDTQNGTRRWSTVGASANIIEASWRALADAVEYGLLVNTNRTALTDDGIHDHPSARGWDWPEVIHATTRVHAVRGVPRPATCFTFPRASDRRLLHRCVRHGADR